MCFVLESLESLEMALRVVFVTDCSTFGQCFVAKHALTQFYLKSSVCVCSTCLCEVRVQHPIRSWYCRISTSIGNSGTGLVKSISVSVPRYWFCLPPHNIGSNTIRKVTDLSI